ncbi:GGDEF domain-containing protein [Rhizobium sp. BK376]|jgi:diguanylate cyclase (GGDEF)-like protein/PAS domain S-box-containing protein|uniref:GGDEF domain-containing protein n=1 Tax=Rhizobium sp. BK376 TaxID=2512149 RepID=UPI0010D7CF4F|nr:GGDEF domain-containing protein [Rhizobium sp. BK376]TCR92225.1 PAS domain S-box-containing protein/diguanylate cyclase (GGDEF)-like protein [Rhizobium sp. BK376]
MEDKEIIEPSVLASMLMRLFEFAPIAMAITTSDTKTSSYAKVNDAYLKLTGLRWEDICGKRLISKGSAIDSPARDRRHRLLAEEGSYVLEEVDIRHADGTIIPTLISAQRTVIDGVSFDVEVILDVSTRVRHQREMELALLESARTDFLTGLPNRAGFEVEVTERLSLERTGTSDLALVYIDLNGFKPVNDTMGHAAGDEVLKTIASRLRENFRSGDYIARVGGDEFVILLDVETPKMAGLLHDLEVAAERIFKPIAVEGLVADVGAAVGVAFLQPDDTSVSFTKRADSYMYIAKSTRQRIAIVALGAAMSEMATAVLAERRSDVA